MANSVVVSLDYDGPLNTRYRVTGILDTSDYAQADITNVSALQGYAVGGQNHFSWLRLDAIQFFIEDGLSCQLWWHDTALTTLIAPLAGRSHAHFEWYGGGITNPKNTGATGNIMLSTTGWSGVKHFTLLLDLTKQ